MHLLIESHRAQLRALASRYGLSSLGVFGSMARDAASSNSDVDFMVEGQRALSGFSLGALLMDAQDLLGRKIDIVTVNSLHPLMRDRGLRESLPIGALSGSRFRADLVFVADMIECIEWVFKYCEGSESIFRQAQLIQDAVIRNFQTMAESSQRLSESIKATASDVPWRTLSGFRKIIVHDYLGVDLDMVGPVVVAALPTPHAALLKIRKIQTNSPDAPQCSGINWDWIPMSYLK